MTTKKKEKLSTAAPPIVINTTMGPKIIPYGATESLGNDGIYDLERCKFRSGLNMPKPGEEFGSVSVLVGYQKWVSDGTLQELESVEQIPDVANTIENLLELSACKESMRWWRERETRPRVRGLLDAKISEMENGRKKSTDD